MNLKFGLIGTDISHSKSPLLFHAAYSNHQFEYNLLDYENFEDAIEEVQSNSYTGVNITSPFKESAYKIATNKSSTTQEAEASNLLIFDSSGITAHNTDYFGVFNTLKNLGIQAQNALVLGCGGAGRAAALALRDYGCNVTIVNRTLEVAMRYSKKFGVEYLPLEKLNPIIESFSLIINTLPPNMEMVDLSRLSNSIVLDANYKRSLIDYLPSQNSVTYIPGEEWLLNQAIPSFKIFTGIEPDVETMKLIIKSI